MYIRHFWGFDLNLYIFNVNLDVNVLIVRACFGAQTCIHMKANTLNDIYFFGRMLYNEFLQNVHLVPKSNYITRQIGRKLFEYETLGVWG